MPSFDEEFHPVKNLIDLELTIKGWSVIYINVHMEEHRVNRLAMYYRLQGYNARSRGKTDHYYIFEVL